MANLSSIITPTNVLTATNTATLTNKTWNSNTIGVAYGGTGATSLTANNVLLGNGTSAVQVVAPGSSGNVLTSNGTTWQSTAGGGMTLLATVTPANGVTSVNVTGLASSKSLIVTGTIGATIGVVLSTSSSVRIKLSVDNGSSFAGLEQAISNSNVTPSGLLAQIYNTAINAQKKIVAATGVSSSTFASETDSTINAGVINAIQIKTDGSATFTGQGTFYIYGMN